MLLTSFATKAWIVSTVALVVIVLFARLMWWLGRVSENGIVMLVRMGMHTMAREVLAALIGYNLTTYHRSRFTVWNQVAPRFAILWTAITIAILLVGFGHWGALALYSTVLISGYLMTLLKRPRHIISQDVKEQQMFGERGLPLSFIRPWNYLDELYAQ